MKISNLHDGVDITLEYSENAQRDGVIEGVETTLKIEVLDVEGEQYEAEIILWKDWDMNHLRDCVRNSILMCDAAPYSVKGTFLGKPTKKQKRLFLKILKRANK